MESRAQGSLENNIASIQVESTSTRTDEIPILAMYYFNEGKLVIPVSV